MRVENYCDVEVAAGREKGGEHARRNDEIHVTDFERFDGAVGLD